MNLYGNQAREFWRQFRPQAYAAMTDPEGFFSTLGEQIADEVDLLAAHLAGPDVPGEAFLGKFGRLTSARLRAEEIAMYQMVYDQDPEIRDEDEDFRHSCTAAIERDFDREMAVLKALESLEMQDEMDQSWREGQNRPTATSETPRTPGR